MQAAGLQQHSSGVAYPVVEPVLLCRGEEHPEQMLDSKWRGRHPDQCLVSAATLHFPEDAEGSEAVLLGFHPVEGLLRKLKSTAIPRSAVTACFREVLQKVLFCLLFFLCSFFFSFFF